MSVRGFLCRHEEALPRVSAVLLLTLCAIAGLRSAWAADEPTAHEASFQYDAKNRRDPFSPLVREGRIVNATSGTKVPTSQPILYGILWDPGGQSIALINDVEVKVGDSIEGYRVMEIRQDAVVLRNGGEPVVLQLAFETPPSPSTTTGGKSR